MLSRKLMLYLVGKRCLHIGLRGCNVTCGYIEKFNDFTNVKYTINHSETLKRQHNLNIIKRFNYNKKSSKNQAQDEEDSDESDDDEETPRDRNSPVVSYSVNSLRTDLLIKAGLNMARNKVETAFYESRIRVNGRKIMKKSEKLSVGDEIDLIRGPSPTNPDFLVVSRIEILGAKGDVDTIRVKLKRQKSLIIENYSDPWKGGAANS